MSRFLLLVLAWACACHAAPPARFHYLSTQAWRAAHPLPEPGTLASEVWPAPGSDCRVLAIRGDVPLHLHADREEWVYFLDGSGTIWVGPEGAGFVPAGAMTAYPAGYGDLFLLPRGTAHRFSGAATVVSIFAPAMPDPPDRVFPAEGLGAPGR